MKSQTTEFHKNFNIYFLLSLSIFPWIIRQIKYSCLRPTASVPRGKKIFKAILQNIQGIKIQLNKSIQRSECKYRIRQGYIQYNPPHVVSYLGFISTRQRLSKLPPFCCLHDTIDVKSETWGPHVDYVTSNVETIAFDVSPAMVSHLTSYHCGYALEANGDIFQFSWSQK